jgi:hypothetical protein
MLLHHYVPAQRLPYRLLRLHHLLSALITSSRYIVLRRALSRGNLHLMQYETLLRKFVFLKNSLSLTSYAIQPMPAYVTSSDIPRSYDLADQLTLHVPTSYKRIYTTTESRRLQLV